MAFEAKTSYNNYMDPLVGINKKALAVASTVRSKLAAVNAEQNRYDDEAFKGKQQQTGEQAQTIVKSARNKLQESATLTPEERQQQLNNIREFEAQQRRNLGLG